MVVVLINNTLFCEITDEIENELTQFSSPWLLKYNLQIKYTLNIKAILIL